jgi:hypothetical protein
MCSFRDYHSSGKIPKTKKTVFINKIALKADLLYHRLENLARLNIKFAYFILVS